MKKPLETNAVQNAGIRQYWNERVHAKAAVKQATTNDIYLRELECRTLIAALEQLSLPAHAHVLDAGCGDGQSTLHVAQKLPDIRFCGLDYAENMIVAARAAQEKFSGLLERVQFQIGDVLNLPAAFPEPAFDAVITDRCLINLETQEDQKRAFAGLAHVLRPGGWYIAIENFKEGHDNMNAARAQMGLPPIPVRWHNLFFEEPAFCKAAEPWFEPPAFHDFASSYYFATRVIYAAACRSKGEEPDYRHAIHQIAVDLPRTGAFSPVRMALLKRKENT